jgi:hypothetical protein
VAGFVDDLGLPISRRCVLLLIDGLGEIQLREHAQAAPFLASRGALSPLRSAIPSTTATSLVSLGTGLQAGVHGMAGYTIRDPGSRRRLNVLKWDLPIEPDQFQPHRPVLARAAAEGVAATVVNDARFTGSGLTRVSQEKVPFIGFTSVWERLELVVDAATAADRTLVYTYEARLDHEGHGHGVGSPQWLGMLREIDAETQRLRDELPEDVVLLVTADHGMINLPDAGRFDVDEYPRLLDDVELLAGEARFRHLYTAPGAADDVAARWRRQLGDHVEVRTRDEASSWFGPIDPAVAQRFGDVLIAAQDDFAVFSSREFAVELRMKGFHGSISDEETAVPLLLA